MNDMVGYLAGACIGLGLLTAPIIIDKIQHYNMKNFMNYAVKYDKQLEISPSEGLTSEAAKALIESNYLGK